MAKPKDDETADTPGMSVEPVAENRLATMDFIDLKSLLTKAKDDATVDPAEIEARIFEQMLRATSLDELLTPQTVLSWRDMLDTPVLVKSVRFNESDFKDGLGLYAIMDAEVDGQSVIMSCGARTPMVQLLIAQHQGWLPARLMLQKSLRATSEGYYPLNMLPAPAEEQSF